MFAKLQGYKTYMVAILMAAITFASYAGYIEMEEADRLRLLIEGIGLSTLRAAIAKVPRR